MRCFLQRKLLKIDKFKEEDKTYFGWKDVEDNGEDPKIILNSQTKTIIFSLLMFVSFFSLFFLYNLLIYKKKGLKFIQEDIYLIFYLIIIIFCFFLFTNKNINF